MYESVSVVGERGQITIPKIIREKRNIKSGEKVLVKMEDSRIVVEKMQSKKEKEELMKEYYSKYAKQNEELSEELLTASAEVMGE